jgi:(E)-4-hydroxy-3-methylbut-2-enyl-diphosphate synthase
MDFFNYHRRSTVDVPVGNLILGGNHRIAIQTMTNTSTLDTEASVAQCERIVAAGADLIRLTAQGVREAENLRNIKCELRKKGYTIPLSADIHFNPKAAETAAKIVEKVRINPGNFADRQKAFSGKEYSEEEYAQGIEHIRTKFVPFLSVCRKYGTAIRIGVNHGSLSDRIMSRYGDTPEGMVESCMEYLRIAVEEEFFDIVISLKASNTLLMTKAVRLLIERMNREGMHFPLHLGVTEAGAGEDGRIKSAVGIGALLSDGIGDTVRVSLSEDPEYEIPVARKLVHYIAQRSGHKPIDAKPYEGFSPFSIERRKSYAVGNIGGDFVPIVVSDRSRTGDMGIRPDTAPDYLYVGKQLPINFPKGRKAIIDYRKGWKSEDDRFPLFTCENRYEMGKCEAAVKFLKLSYPELTPETLEVLKSSNDVVIVLETSHVNGVGEQRAFFHRLLRDECRIPVIICREYGEDEPEDIQIKAGADLGTLLLDGFGDGIMLSNKGKIDVSDTDAYAFGILQAARVRMSKAEFISCPGCGRTLFDLQETVALVKQALSHLKNLKIAVMGCIVNGPGEMADADYGYVGSERGKISLYKKQQLVEKNIPADQAVERLIRLLKENGDWVEPDEN